MAQTAARNASRYRTPLLPSSGPIDSRKLYLEVLWEEYWRSVRVHKVVSLMSGAQHVAVRKHGWGTPIPFASARSILTGRIPGQSLQFQIGAGPCVQLLWRRW
jgi:hypothetical protein